MPELSLTQTANTKTIKNPTAKRTGARNRAEVTPQIRQALNQGTLETANLVEMLVVDFKKLLSTLYSEIPKNALKALSNVEALGITKRMALAAEIILDHYGISEFHKLKNHGSDMVRSWACYMIGKSPMSFDERFRLIRPLADDSHSGVREWAWIALRPHIAENLSAAIELLTPWILESSANLRRYAVEITRPRGVWCAHIDILKKNPAIGLPLLEPLNADPSKYVQDSVANWLNDAAKTEPHWVTSLCARWQKKTAAPSTLRICKRALRSLP